MVGRTITILLAGRTRPKPYGVGSKRGTFPKQSIAVVNPTHSVRSTTFWGNNFQNGENMAQQLRWSRSACRYNGMHIMMAGGGSMTLRGFQCPQIRLRVISEPLAATSRYHQLWIGQLSLSQAWLASTRCR